MQFKIYYFIKIGPCLIFEGGGDGDGGVAKSHRQNIEPFRLFL